MRIQYLALAGAVIAGCVFRLDGLGRELGHDEAYSWVKFASRSYEYIATTYFIPNNHIFHSVLMRLAVQLFGKAEWTIRLVALVAGVMAIPAVFLLCRELTGQAKVGLAASWILACMPVHISYSQVARGYTLLVLLALVAWACVSRALNGHGTFWWLAFAAAGALGAYTIPSGAFHLATLMVWAGIVLLARKDRAQLIRFATASAVAIALLLVAYVPLREDLAHAASIWGVSLRDDPTALLTLIRDVALKISAGGIAGMLAAAAALYGLGVAVWKSRELSSYFAVAWLLPFGAALVMGVAGYPRSYLFLLPSFVVAVAHGLVAIPNRIGRMGALGIILAAYLRVSTVAFGTLGGHGYEDAANYLESSSRAGDVIVMPYIMDVPLGYYAGRVALRRLTEVLREHRIDRLLLATHATDARLQLGNYSLVRDDLMRSGIRFSEQSFVELFASGSTRLQLLTRDGIRVFPRESEVWSVDREKGTSSLRAAPGEPLLSDWPSICVASGEGEGFQLNSSSRFSVPRLGVVVMASARSHPDAKVALCQVEDEAGVETISPLNMMRSFSLQQAAATPDGTRWYVEATLRPVEAGATYGVSLTGVGGGKQYFAEIIGFYFPF